MNLLISLLSFLTSIDIKFTNDVFTNFWSLIKRSHKFSKFACEFTHKFSKFICKSTHKFKFTHKFIKIILTSLKFLITN